MTALCSPELSVALDCIVRELARDFEGMFSKKTIARYAEESATALASPRCFSCASTTRAAARWQPPCSITTRAAGRTPGRPEALRRDG